MHESEAMDFITAVLRGFMERTFKIFFNEDNKNFYISLMEKLKTFIKDENGYWVKQKSLEVIHYMGNIETRIADGEFKPESPESCIDIAIYLAQEKMKAHINLYRTGSPNRVHDVFPLPILLLQPE